MCFGIQMLETGVFGGVLVGLTAYRIHEKGRMLGLFGLHHIFYLPFRTTGLGGSEIINGQLIEGTNR